MAAECFFLSMALKRLSKMNVAAEIALCFFSKTRLVVREDNFHEEMSYTDYSLRIPRFWISMIILSWVYSY